MGGTGGSDYSVSPRPRGPEQSDEDLCRSLRFTTNLEPSPSGPIRDEGDVLTVVPTVTGGGTAFVAVDVDGEAVGTIVEKTDSLLRCTNIGISYEAVVEHVFFDTHTVLVRASSGERA